MTYDVFGGTLSVTQSINLYNWQTNGRTIFSLVVALWIKYHIQLCNSKVKGQDHRVITLYTWQNVLQQLAGSQQATDLESTLCNSDKFQMSVNCQDWEILLTTKALYLFVLNLFYKVQYVVQAGHKVGEKNPKFSRLFLEP